MELLLTCARVDANSARPEQIKALLRQDLEWEQLIDAALGHGILPLLYHSLTAACPDEIPSAAMDRLDNGFHNNVWNSLVLSGELLKHLNLLGEHGIPAVPFRGPLLAETVYGDYAMRQAGDLDILVHEKDVLMARDLLISHGYQPACHLTRAQERAYLRAQSEFRVIRDEGEVIVELHWRMTERYFAFALDPKELWARLVPASLAGEEVRIFSPEDLLLVLCVHGTKHVWERLMWISDVARVVSTCDQMDWRRVMERARRLGSVRMLLLGLLLAHDLLGATLPGEMLDMARADPAVGSLAAQVRQQLLAGGRPGPLGVARFHLRARERWRDRVEYAWRLAVTTTAGDWEMLRLPDPLFPLYYLLRPLRLLRVYGAAVLRRVL
jgi:hypothetical protein